MLSGWALAYWLWRRMGLGAWLLPPRRQRAVPWGGFEVVGAVGVYFFGLFLAAALLQGTGWLNHIYGPGFMEQKDLLSTTRRNLWTFCLAVPFQVAGILLLFRATCDARAYQLGLTTHRFGSNILLGVLAWLATTPLVLLLLVLVVLLGAAFGVSPEKHPLESVSRSDWPLLALAVSLGAPLTEELLFRGVLQRFLMNRWWGGDVALAGAYVLAILPRWEGLREAVQTQDGGQFLQEAQPALFVLAMLGVYLMVRRFWPSLVVRTIYGVALLFAAAHAAVWPTPVPLFVLALVLGWLAQRTQSLVGPIVLHGLFNSVSVVILVAGHGEAEKGKPDTTAGRRPPAVSTSSFVPGS